MEIIWHTIPVMGILGCQLDNIWTELQSRNGGHICNRFCAWFEMNGFTFSQDIPGRKTPVFDPDLEAGRQMPLIQFLR